MSDITRDWKYTTKLLCNIDFDRYVYLTVTAIEAESGDIIRTFTHMDRRFLPPADMEAEDFPDVWRTPIMFFVSDFLRFEEMHAAFPEDVRKRLFVLHWVVSLARPSWVRKRLGTVRDGGLDDLRWAFLKRALMTVLKTMEPESVGYSLVMDTVPFSVERDYFTGRCIARAPLPKTPGTDPAWMTPVRTSTGTDPFSVILSVKRSGEAFEIPCVSLYDLAKTLTKDVGLSQADQVDAMMTGDYLRADDMGMKAFEVAQMAKERMEGN